MSDHLIRELGGGLVLRHATPADADELAAMNIEMHDDAGAGPWTRMLLSGRHPTVAPGDTLVVVDTGVGQIVSVSTLISQTWSYGGIAIKAGRIELVSTRKAYRNRGLVRAIFDELHRISLARGELVNGITGIPWYYRQFGYEMAMALGGARQGGETDVPRLAEGETEPYLIRPATTEDAPLIARLQAAEARRWLVSCPHDETLLRYEMLDKGDEGVTTMKLFIITTPEGIPAGFVGIFPNEFYGSLNVFEYELDEGFSFHAVSPTVMRWAWEQGKQVAEKRGKPLEHFGFMFGDCHPVYEAYPRRLPVIRPPYAWYVRVPDLPAFLHAITPLLEQRLAASEAARGFSGDVKLSFYRSGLALAFDHGRLVVSRHLGMSELDGAVASFPDLTFLQVLFGHRGLADLKAAYADLWVNEDKAGALLRALFPVQASHIWAVD